MVTPTGLELRIKHQTLCILYMTNPTLFLCGKQTNKQTNKTIFVNIYGDKIPYQWLSINCKESGYSPCPRFPLLHQQLYLFAFHLPFWPTCSLESVSCCLGHLAAIGCCNSTCFWLDAHNTRTYSMYVHGTINGTWYTYAYIHSGFQSLRKKCGNLNDKISRQN